MKSAYLFFMAFAFLSFGTQMAGNEQVAAKNLDRTKLPGGPSPSTLEPLRESYPRQILNLLIARQKQEAQIGLTDEKFRGIAAITHVWRPDKYNDKNRIRICFFNRNNKVNTRIVAIAKRWKLVRGVKLPLDFGSQKKSYRCKDASKGPYHIRVSFNQKEDHWSLIGSDAVHPPLQRMIGLKGKPSLNISFDNKTILNPSNKRKLRRVVLHEFGHAFGLKHEHQHFGNDCGWEYNLGEIRDRYENAEEIIQNLKLLTKRGMLATKYDKSSIMHYPLPANYFHKGSRHCNGKTNFALSKGDREMIVKLYPKNKKLRLASWNKGRTKIFRGLRELTESQNSSGGAMKYRAALDYLNFYLGPPDKDATSKTKEQ